MHCFILSIIDQSYDVNAVAADSLLAPSPLLAWESHGLLLCG